MFLCVVSSVFVGLCFLASEKQPCSTCWLHCPKHHSDHYFVLFFSQCVFLCFPQFSWWRHAYVCGCIFHVTLFLLMLIRCLGMVRPRSICPRVPSAPSPPVPHPRQAHRRKVPSELPPVSLILGYVRAPFPKRKCEIPSTPYALVIHHQVC